jgi:hypothetical protein
MLTGISLLTSATPADHTPVRPFTILGKEFHPNCKSGRIAPATTAFWMKLGIGVEVHLSTLGPKQVSKLLGRFGTGSDKPPPDAHTSSSSKSRW